MLSPNPFGAARHKRTLALKSEIAAHDLISSAAILPPSSVNTKSSVTGLHAGHPDLKGFGDGKRAFFWLKEGKPDPKAVHVGFVAKDHAEVDAFYKAAVAAGGKSKEAPQVRLEYYPGYYATWVLDPDGHDIEVVHKS